MLANRGALGSVLEATWLTSSGASLRALSDASAFDISLNVPCEGEAAPAIGKLCLWPAPAARALELELCGSADVRRAHERLLAVLPRPAVAPS